MKERLLNLAIERLPPHVTKVAWVDADTLFTNPAWAQKTSALLDTWPVVQPFAMEEPLPRNKFTAQGRGHPGFAHQQCCNSPARHSVHGASGLAWAGRRKLLQRHGLYDTAILGSGDELWTHAISGRMNSSRVCGITGSLQLRHRLVPARVSGWLERLYWPDCLIDWRLNRIRLQLPALVVIEPFMAHYLAWATHLYAVTRGRMTFTEGVALHLWHGSPARRQYSKRNEILRGNRFNPITDLRLNEQGLWEWASDKIDLHRELLDYFKARREDDNA